MVLKNLYRLSLAGALLALSGCGITYLAQATHGQLAVLGARHPIDALVANSATPDPLKQELLRAKRIRDFATHELGLPDNAAYRTYADIGRPYVVWNVVATPEFSVQPLQWCFPVAGCVAYRGYFKEAAARRFAATLKARGDDVLVGGVPAYSTLGHFADPLLSSVAGYSELDLAALIFHELAHQKAYLPGDTSYNEAFATAVEAAGVARYARRYADAPTLADWQRRQRFREQVVALFGKARGDLAQLYRTRLAPAAMRARKAQRLAQLTTQVDALEQREGMRSGFGAWLDAGLNNAHLASVATYYDQVPYFTHILESTCGGYFPCLYVAVRREIAAREASDAAQKNAPP